MSGFASLLNQFKQTTEQATSKTAPSLVHKPSASRPIKTYKEPTTPVTRIFIACPPIETGGPEALHQLCHVINSGGYEYPLEKCGAEEAKVDEFGREMKNCTKAEKKGRVRAYMLYLKERHDVVVVADGVGRPSKYLRYDAPVADVLPGVGCSVGEDGYCSDLVVWPEIWTKHIDAFRREANESHDRFGYNDSRKKYQIAIWWLSVDNNRGAFSPNDFKERCDVLHLVQSYYARQYVTSHTVGKGPSNEKAKILDMTEFIPYANESGVANADGAEGTKEKDTQTRDLDVVYNPLKGMHYTDEIIRRSKNKRARTGDGSATTTSAIPFTAIGGGEGARERISGEEVVALLKRAKVYIDFGHHPGMDRLPREAALAGCIVLTNREGAANYDKDVPLPSVFKFASFNADKVYALLKEICCDSIKFDEYSVKMQTYKKWIIGQEYRMRVCVDKLIGEVVTKRIDGKIPSNDAPNSLQ